ncbi:hypothetical protein SNEBB_003939 [Seison nebaliae]|nr:hypothetical protein SNEBB_003939 [Seison nebaliae]
MKLSFIVHIIISYTTPIIIICGTFCNLLSIAVFLRKQLRSLPVSIYTVALNVVDTVALILLTGGNYLNRWDNLYLLEWKRKKIMMKKTLFNNTDFYCVNETECFFNSTEAFHYPSNMSAVVKPNTFVSEGCTFESFINFLNLFVTSLSSYYMVTISIERWLALYRPMNRAVIHKNVSHRVQSTPNYSRSRISLMRSDRPKISKDENTTVSLKKPSVLTKHDTTVTITTYKPVNSIHRQTIITVMVIFILSILFNLWVLFMFNYDKWLQRCIIAMKWREFYRINGFISIVAYHLLPFVIIATLNLSIIVKIRKIDKKTTRNMRSYRHNNISSSQLNKRTSQSDPVSTSSNDSKTCISNKPSSQNRHFIKISPKTSFNRDSLFRGDSIHRWKRSRNDNPKNGQPTNSMENGHHIKFQQLNKIQKKSLKFKKRNSIGSEKSCQTNTSVKSQRIQPSHDVISLTIMLVAKSICFLISVFPFQIFWILRNWIQMPIFENHELMNAIGEFVLYLRFLNFALNFFLYSATSTIFRQQLQLLFIEFRK